jgi:hypothetical protein
MFERLKDRIGTALDCLVEFSTLGEYRLAAPRADGSAIAPPPSASRGSGLGGLQLSGIAHPGAAPARAAVGPACRTVAVGAIGTAPVATSAARRLPRGSSRARSVRRPAPARAEQPCLSAAPVRA